MMSAGDTTFSVDLCASCGIAAVDDIKLKYVSFVVAAISCVIAAMIARVISTTKTKKRKAELHDRELFTQPDGICYGECPLCCLPLHSIPAYSIMMSCCSKIICNGCSYENKKREIEQGVEHSCAFCREPEPKSLDEYDKQIMKRVKKNNDPVAITEMGKKHFGEHHYVRAAKYWTKAAEMGNLSALHLMGNLYNDGNGVEKDITRAIRHWEKAAIGGHPQSRYNLGIHEKTNGRFKRAARHLIIAASLGEERSPNAVKELFVQGKASKEDYAAALRGYQAAVEATTSLARKKAVITERNGHYL
jgi:hypothetical protein